MITTTACGQIVLYHICNIATPATRKRKSDIKILKIETKIANKQTQHNTVLEVILHFLILCLTRSFETHFKYKKVDATHILLVFPLKAAAPRIHKTQHNTTQHKTKQNKTPNRAAAQNGPSRIKSKSSAFKFYRGIYQSGKIS
jgi:hypothetical protein